MVIRVGLRSLQGIKALGKPKFLWYNGKKFKKRFTFFTVNHMSSAPEHPPEAAGAEAEAHEVATESLPAIKEARTGFFRWVGLTLKNSVINVKNAISAVTWKPTAYVFRKAYSVFTWPANYLDSQWEILKGSRIGKGVGFALNSENYKIFGGGHGHGGGHDEGAEHHG